MNIATIQEHMKPVDFVKSYYRIFNKFHSREYRVEKMSKRMRKGISSGMFNNQSF